MRLQDYLSSYLIIPLGEEQVSSTVSVNKVQPSSLIDL